jgi:hypothetical protein
MKRLAGIVLGLLATGAAAATLAACGSSSSTTSSRGGSTGTAGSLPSALAPGESCQSLIARTLGTVAQRIYAAARHGNVVGQAVHRVQASRALAQAVSANDAPAATAALRSLLAGQIAQVRVTKAGKPFATAGSGVAIAPVRGTIDGTGARFELSTQAARSYLKVAQQVTGAEVVLLAAATGSAVIDSTLAPGALRSEPPAHGPFRLGGRVYQSFTLPGSLYMLGAMRIVLLVPQAHGVSCSGSPSQTAIEAIGRVGERIYREEADSPTVRATLRHIEADGGFRQAVAARDTAAIRAAIVRFFGEHIHVVRVRVYAVQRGGAQRLLYDLGGPYVLAPVHGVVRSGGQVVGRFSYAIQDDAGYLRLAHLFTGAEILMRTGGKQVMGTLDPGPVRVPRRGTLHYGGRRYAAYTFIGEAFPSGPLQISLLVPRGG